MIVPQGGANELGGQQAIMARLSALDAALQEHVQAVEIKLQTFDESTSWLVETCPKNIHALQEDVSALQSKEVAATKVNEEVMNEVVRLKEQQERTFKSNDEVWTAFNKLDNEIGELASHTNQTSARMFEQISQMNEKLLQLPPANEVLSLISEQPQILSQIQDLQTRADSIESLVNQAQLVLGGLGDDLHDKHADHANRLATVEMSFSELTNHLQSTDQSAVQLASRVDEQAVLCSTIQSDSSTMHTTIRSEVEQSRSATRQLLDDVALTIKDRFNSIGNELSEVRTDFKLDLTKHKDQVPCPLEPSDCHPIVFFPIVLAKRPHRYFVRLCSSSCQHPSRCQRYSLLGGQAHTDLRQRLSKVRPAAAPKHLASVAPNS